MDEFKTAIDQTVEDAITAAGASTRLWFGAFAHLVDGAANTASTPATADTFTADMTQMMTASATGMARAFSTWVTIGVALSNVNIGGANGNGGNGGNGGGNGGAGGNGGNG